MPGEPIVAPPVIPDEQPKIPEQTGSNIQAAAGALGEKNETHNEAVATLAGGRRRRRSGRRRRRTLRGGAVEVKAVPQFVSAGGVDPKAAYADLLQTAHSAKAAGVYDGMGDKPPVNMNSMDGGRRGKRSTVKRNNGGKRRQRIKRSTLLRSRRTRRGSRRVRHSRR